jgi:pimeloyl-ACP methyl ester carboxylesterase
MFIRPAWPLLLALILLAPPSRALALPPHEATFDFLILGKTEEGPGLVLGKITVEQIAGNSYKPVKLVVTWAPGGFPLGDIGPFTTGPDDAFLIEDGKVRKADLLLTLPDSSSYSAISLHSVFRSAVVTRRTEFIFTGGNTTFIPSIPKLTPVQRTNLPAWVKQRNATLTRGAKVIRTSAGPVQYVKRGRGPVVICLHGGFGGYDASYGMGEFLVNRGFTVIAVSRPGYLGTPLSVGRSQEQQADAIVAMMDAMKLKNAFVYGFSAGCPVAFQMGLRHPTRVRALVMTGLGAPASSIPDYPYIAYFLRADAGLDVLPYGLYLLTREDLPLATSILLSLDSDLAGNAARQRLDHVLHSLKQRTWARQFAISLTPLSSRRLGTLEDVDSVDPWGRFEKKGQFGRFGVPTLIIQAKDDTTGSFEEARRIAGRLKTARFLPVMGAGHFIWMGKNTDAWQNAMVRYLERHKP